MGACATIYGLLDMKLSQIAVVCASLFAAALGARASAFESKDLVVRIAELEIDPPQLAVYLEALKEEIEASVRLEPGVLALNAVAEKEHPTRIRLLEIYANDGAYRAHLDSPHFRKYKVSTGKMVKSLRLVETTPIMLGSKPR